MALIIGLKVALIGSADIWYCWLLPGMSNGLIWARTSAEYVCIVLGHLVLFWATVVCTSLVVYWRASRRGFEPPTMS